MYDVIIIGAGPAGITAGLYTQRGNLKTLIIHNGKTSLENANKIENYYGFENGITGKELYFQGIKQAQIIGIDVKNEEVIKIILNNKDDVRLKYFLNEYIENLAIGISNLINIFEPEKILIGGGFAEYKEILLEPLKQQLLTGNLLFNKRNDIIIQLAKFKNDAGIIGATLI